jgi:hypothetical protein
VTYEDNDLRVRQTLEPAVKLLGIEPTIFMITNDFDFRKLSHELRTKYGGKAVLVVSHSDFVKEIINTLGGDETRCPIDGYDNLCVVTTCGQDTVHVLRLRYGATK